MKKILFVLCLITAFSRAYSQDSVPVKDAVASTVTFFDLKDVRLLEGSPFYRAMELNRDWLLELEPDRLLSKFMENAGLKPLAAPYGGWESAALAGHTLGHYLTAVAQQYAATSDERFRERIEYTVSILDSCQREFVNGYIGAIPGGDRLFKQVKKGIIRSFGFDLNGIWSPWYTEHKVLTGLCDAYTLAGNELALKVLVNLADYFWDCIRDLSDEQMQNMMNCEFGGMNEAFAQVYAITGDGRYLDASYKFYHKRVADPIAKGEDILPGLHSNTQIPKIIGSAREYELTGCERDRNIAENFWDIMVQHHSYANGGNSSAEYLSAPDELNDRLTNSTCETCNTYNMLKLTQHLYQWTGDVSYMDYYEKALYNHILASQNHGDGMTCYFVPLAMGTHKEFSDKENTFTCCMGTGFENHSKYGGAIFAHSADALFVNLYIPSELFWEEKGLKVRMETGYPENGLVTLKVLEAPAAALTVNVRYPVWAHKGISVKVNGVSQKVNGVSGSYIPIQRLWKAGDVVKISVPMDIYTVSVPDNEDRRAIFYGPTMLAGDLGVYEEPFDWVEDEDGHWKPVPNGKKELTIDDVPVFVSADKRIAPYVVKDGKNFIFRTSKLGYPTDVRLMPFYDISDQFYSVYWDVFSPAEWARKQAEYEAQKQHVLELEKVTVDFLQMGEMQPERDHNLETNDRESRVGDFRNRKFRYLYPNGRMSFDMKVDPQQPVKLVMTFFGGDCDGRCFRIFVDGEPFTCFAPVGEPDKFVENTLEIPFDLTRGKETIRFTFQGYKEPGRVTVYDCRMTR